MRTISAVGSILKLIYIVFISVQQTHKQPTDSKIYSPRSPPLVWPSTPVSTESSCSCHLHLQPEGSGMVETRVAPRTRWSDVLGKYLKQLGATLMEASNIALDRTRWRSTIVAPAVRETPALSTDRILKRACSTEMSEEGVLSIQDLDHSGP